MRASQSRTTVLDGAFAAPDRIVRRLDPGPNADPLIFGIFASFELLLAAVYAGIGARALDLAVAAAHRRTSMKRDGAPLAQDPDIRWRVADAAIAQDAIEPQLLAVARDLDGLVDHGSRWFAKLVGVKVRATETAKHVVDQAVRVVGRLVVLRRLGARPALPRRARRHLPPLRRRVGAQHGGERLARAGRGLSRSSAAVRRSPADAR